MVEPRNPVDYMGLTLHNSFVFILLLFGLCSILPPSHVSRNLYPGLFVSADMDLLAKSFNVKAFRPT